MTLCLASQIWAGRTFLILIHAPEQPYVLWQTYAV